MAEVAHDHEGSGRERPDPTRSIDRAGPGSPGERLPVSTAAYFGARYGHDFSSVRVHTDAHAGADAGSLRARAFTVGSDIHFAPGRYDPHTADGQRLLAHELAHVVQQQGRPAAGTRPDRSGERAADDAAARALSGGSVHIGPMRVIGPQLQEAGPPGSPAQAPLTPAELWKLAHDQRGFESTSSGKGDDYRSKPATVPPGALDVDPAGNPVARGAPLGKGFETVASVQVLDANGNQVGVARGIFHSGGPENHAEARAVRALEGSTPARVPGGRLVVVGDQTICPTCRARLVAYAQSRGLTVIEPHEPSRARLRGQGTVSPKTASRTSTMAGMPQVAVERVAPIPVTPTTGPGRGPGGGAPPGPSPSTTATATAPTPAKATPAAPTPTKATPGAATTGVAAPTSGRFTKGTVTVELTSSVGKGSGKVGITSIDTSGFSADKGVTLSKSPTGAALVNTYSAAQMSRLLLDVSAMGADADTAAAIQKVTNPLRAHLRSKITSAKAAFLASHPDPATLASRIDAAQLRDLYEQAWTRLSAPRHRRALLAIVLALTPEGDRGPEWHEAARNLGTAGVSPQNLAAFRSVAQAYEKRMIDTLQEIASHRADLPQIARELDQRAVALDRIAADLEEMWWWIIQRVPLAFYVMPNLYSESQFIHGLAGEMSSFAEAVRARDSAYQRLDDEFDAQLRQVGRHLADPGSAVREAVPRSSRRR